MPHCFFALHYNKSRAPSTLIIVLSFMFALKPALVVVSTMRESLGRRVWILISAAVATGYLFRSFATHSVSDRANVGHLIQHSRANLRLARPSEGCTAEQQKQQAQAFSEKINANHNRWSSCPSEAILKAIHAADPAEDIWPTVFHPFVCNKTNVMASHSAPCP